MKPSKEQVEKARSVLQKLAEKLILTNRTPQAYISDVDLIAQALADEREKVLNEAEKELEAAHEECDTYNLLHGAARIWVCLHELRKTNNGNEK